MSHPLRPIAYVLAATNHGSLIVNRNDRRESEPGVGIGVGFQLLAQSAFDPPEISFAMQLLSARRQEHGPGVVAIDGGANLGVHTVEWARHMHGWGTVLGFEAQEFVFYALAGNVAINNCLNATVRWAALGESPGTIDVPQPDYLQPGSFGSLELKQRKATEFIGQAVSYRKDACKPTPMVSIDSLGLTRLDLLKLDVEGMEVEVLRGARRTLKACKPILLVEVIKTDQAALLALLGELGYRVEPYGMNLLALHPDDPCSALVRRVDTVTPASTPPPRRQTRRTPPNGSGGKP
jgi:FkbM family methyltransferase